MADCFVKLSAARYLVAAVEGRQAAGVATAAADLFAPSEPPSGLQVAVEAGDWPATSLAAAGVLAVAAHRLLAPVPPPVVAESAPPSPVAPAACGKEMVELSARLAAAALGVAL